MKKSDINILVVDDDAGIRDLLTTALKRFGYRPTAIGKIEEAINAVKIKHFHAAVIDCMLPRKNGVDFSVEMRGTRFANAPIILMSGIFKDKGFAAEAQSKTGAIAFLNKPINMDDLKRTLDAQFADLVSNENVPLHVLVSKPFSSPRERTKVIEGLDQVKGFDLPFVLCVLMDAGASGHLNLATAEGDIFGVSLSQGKIAGVDSGESEKTLIKILEQSGFVSADEVLQLRKGGRRGDLLAALLEEQMISPHNLPQIKRQLVIGELRKLFSGSSVNINFVPERSSKAVDFAVELEELTPLLHEVVVKSMTEPYLREFYSQWMEYPIQVGTGFRPDHKVFQLKIFEAVPGLAADLAGQVTMEEILQKGKYPPEAFFKAIHLLAFRRLIIFDDVKKVKSTVEYGQRMATLLKDLSGKNPFQVFAYFGAPPDAPTSDVERIYREFARANHPDLLPPSASPDLRKVVNQVFSIVSEANTVLSVPEKRAALVNSLKQTEAETQIRAEALVEEAVNFLRRGRATEALERTREAIQLNASRSVILAHVWALVKSPGLEKSIPEVKRLMDSIPHEERRVPQYHFVLGLVKKALGDSEGALNQFDKALAADPNYLEARREKSLLGETTGKNAGFDADLTRLVGNFFKKRG